MKTEFPVNVPDHEVRGENLNRLSEQELSARTNSNRHGAGRMFLLKSNLEHLVNHQTEPLSQNIDVFENLAERRKCPIIHFDLLMSHRACSRNWKRRKDIRLYGCTFRKELFNYFIQLFAFPVIISFFSKIPDAHTCPAD